MGKGREFVNWSGGMVNAKSRRSEVFGREKHVNKQVIRARWYARGCKNSDRGLRGQRWHVQRNILVIKNSVQESIPLIYSLKSRPPVRMESCSRRALITRKLQRIEDANDCFVRWEEIGHIGFLSGVRVDWQHVLESVKIGKMEVEKRWGNYDNGGQLSRCPRMNRRRLCWRSGDLLSRTTKYTNSCPNQGIEFSCFAALL